jgi:hypothetical protein
MRRLALVFILAASVAHADSRAWTAAKKVLPDGLTAVVGISVGPIRSSKLFEAMWPRLMANAGDAQTTFNSIKATCKLDVPGVIDSMVVGMNEAQQGVIVVALQGATQKDLDACFDKLSKADGKPMTVSAGTITKYTSEGKDLYIRWLGKDVGAMATSPDDKDLLARLTAGGNKLKPQKTGSALWLTVDKQQDLDQLHAKMTGAYGSVDLKAGTVSAEVHVVLDSAKSAKQSSDQIAAAKQASGQLPPALKPLIDTLVVRSSGNELVLTASMAEADVIQLIGLVASTMGGH